MFGLILPHRPVLTPPTPITPIQQAFTFPPSPPFAHLVLFLLPNESLPPGHAATIHIRSTPAGEFRLLGAIANDKPNAMFKIGGELDAPAAGGGGGDVVVGLSIEPVESVQAQLSGLRGAANGGHAVQHGAGVSQQQTQVAPYNQPTAQLDTARVKVLAQRIIKDAFDFLGGFARGPPGEEVVPLRGFREWWAKFERKVELDSEWLERKIMQD